VSPSEKAAFHQIEGAGRGRVVRKFFGLNGTDEDAIVDRIDKHLAKIVKG
jgi:phage gpG-like protein